jgi:hypothetical protein
MASLTQSNVALPLHSGASATVRIEPPRGLLELRLREVWLYRELLYGICLTLAALWLTVLLLLASSTLVVLGGLLFFNRIETTVADRV